MHSFQLLHLILCRVEEVIKADNYEASKKKDYYQIPISRENIHFLQTWEETLQCWEKVLQVSVTCQAETQSWMWPLPSTAYLPKLRIAAALGGSSLGNVLGIVPEKVPVGDARAEKVLCVCGTDTKNCGCWQGNAHVLDRFSRLLLSTGRLWKQKVSVLQPGQVVGVDMEWKPSFGMVGKPRVALLQLALKDEVFLLDLPQLLKQADAEGEKDKLSHFIQMLYSDTAITKLGNTPPSSRPWGFTQPVLSSLSFLGPLHVVIP